MIKVYFADIELLNEGEVFERWFAQMHPLRKEKIRRCKQEVDKKRSLLAGILLKLALEKEGYSYETLDFVVEAHGRPLLKNTNEIHFSLSHAGTYALCCISDQRIGADIETTEKSIFQEGKEGRMHEIASKMLTQAEYENYMQGCANEKKALFLKYWTQKESYSKASGEGLRMKFSEINTEEIKDAFWSKWLTDTCFASVYTGLENGTEIEVQKIVVLEI